MSVEEKLCLNLNNLYSNQYDISPLRRQLNSSKTVGKIYMKSLESEIPFYKISHQKLHKPRDNAMIKSRPVSGINKTTP
jgi:hypothetical protein